MTKPSAKKTETAVVTAGPVEIPDDQIPDTIEGIAKWVLDNEVEVRKAALVYWWNIGKMVATIQADEGKYGSKAVALIAEKSGKNERLLYNAHNLYKDHPKFNSVCALAIEWSSVREIQLLPDARKRRILEQKAADRNMTVKEVKEEVRKIKGKSKPKDKKPKAPKGPNALSYFMLLDDLMAKLGADTDRHLKDISAMLALVSDEYRTPDEDYNIIVEGDKNNDPLAVKISKKAASLVQKLQQYVIPLKDTFNDTEDSGAEDPEEEA